MPCNLCHDVFLWHHAIKKNESNTLQGTFPSVTHLEQRRRVAWEILLHPSVTRSHGSAPLGSGNTEAASGMALKTDAGMTVLSTASALVVTISLLFLICLAPCHFFARGHWGFSSPILTLSFRGCRQRAWSCHRFSHCSKSKSIAFVSFFHVRSYVAAISKYNMALNQGKNRFLHFC